MMCVHDHTTALSRDEVEEGARALWVAYNLARYGGPNPSHLWDQRDQDTKGIWREVYKAALTTRLGDRDQPPASSGKALTGKAQGPWRPISTAPKYGTEIWAWLSDSGVRKVRWWSAEELCEEEGRYTPDFYQAGFYEVADKTEWWNPAWWAPADRLPAPPASSGQGGR